MPVPVLIRAQRAARARAEAQEAYVAAVREAHAAGYSLRQIGQSVGVSHVEVLRLVRTADS